MTELADGVVGSRRGLTHQAGLLAKAGPRHPRSQPRDDQRATLVTITDAGLALAARVMPGHVEVARELLFAPAASASTTRTRRTIDGQYQHAIIMLRDPDSAELQQLYGRLSRLQQEGVRQPMITLARDNDPRVRRATAPPRRAQRLNSVLVRCSRVEYVAQGGNATQQDRLDVVVIEVAVLSDQGLNPIGQLE
ncbi:hypothetical protein SAMN05216207_104045 [Pseudonocardia ammonioxydans]|uniref:HTH marR-type domain-containing protein n=1 Tax=Pseudonocardia ammonioxydans TaxID=260086 RepID=A0A1I5FSS0_PSUAM|nr:hypothetical protein SAMN05216207_104045 [Pseudonocardia ammonioxydans]